MLSIIRKILNFISKPFFICFDIKKRKNNVKMNISENKIDIINYSDDIQRNNDSYSPTCPRTCVFFKGREIEKDATPPSYTKKRPENISFCSASQDLFDLDSPFITKQDIKKKNRVQSIKTPNTVHDDSDSIESERNLKIKKS